MKEEEILQLVRERMKDRPKIVSMFENCYQDTLEKTIIRQEDGQVFMLTGDIQHEPAPPVSVGGGG